MDKRVEAYIEEIKRRGLIVEGEGRSMVFKGPAGGCTKKTGPLAGKRIGCLVASEFSDFQAYYIAAYIGEFGGKLDFILVDEMTWHWTRPNNTKKGVQGMWGLSVDPIPVGGGEKADTAIKADDARASDYDALIILGGPSGDIMSTVDSVKNLLKDVYDNGGLVGGIGGGIIPLLTIGLTDGVKCTGNEQVDFILRNTADFTDAPCEIDQRVLTAKNTIDTPEFVSSLCRYFDPEWKDTRKGMLAGKTMMLIAGWDFEDFEIAVPFLEFYHRGAAMMIGTFTGCIRNRPALLGLDVVQGNFGMTIPLQEVPDELYTIKDLKDISQKEIDGLMIPGAFCPWNMIEAKYPLQFLRDADRAENMVAFMCHGPIAVAASGIAKGRKSTGWISCKPSFDAVGGNYSNEWFSTIDGHLVSGKTTPELPEFIDAMTLGLLL